MKYQVIIKKLADSQFKIIKKSGDRKSLKRLQQILDELELHLATGIGYPEQLKNQLSGY